MYIIIGGYVAYYVHNIAIEPDEMKRVAVNVSIHIMWVENSTVCLHL